MEFFSKACRALLFRVVLIGYCALPAVVRAQETVSLPTYDVGNVWVYERISRYNNQVELRRSEEVVAVAADAVKMRVKTTKGLNEEWTYSPELNFISGGAFSTKPSFAVLKFPFTQGTEWSIRYARVQPNMTFNGSLNVKVVGREKVTTSAGAFDTLVLEFNSHADGGGRARERYWYAPSVKRVIRREYESHFGTGVRNDYYREVIVAYILGEERVGFGAAAGCATDDYLCAAGKVGQ